MSALDVEAWRHLAEREEDGWPVTKGSVRGSRPRASIPPELLRRSGVAPASVLALLKQLG